MLGVFLDTETNGLSPNKHHILDLAFKILDLETGKCLSNYTSLINQPSFIWEESDPGSLTIHGLKKEDIENGKEKEVVEKEVIALFEKHNIKRGSAVFICQNPSFDRPFFSQIIDVAKQEEKMWPYHWLDLASMHWAKLAFEKKEMGNISFSKDAIAHHHNLPPEKKPHGALSGVDHLILCYQSIVGFPNS